MDIEYEHRGILFCWDQATECANMQKHEGVTFRQAAQVFFDPFLSASADEVRGADVHFHVLFVHAVIEDGEWIRVVSARKAAPVERQRYEDGND